MATLTLENRPDPEAQQLLYSGQTLSWDEANPVRPGRPAFPKKPEVQILMWNLSVCKCKHVGKT